tara:strand:+ start:209 stop:328 length:120 start_codon:yes stop_codon:yes gene_type:complete
MNTNSLSLNFRNLNHGKEKDNAKDVTNKEEQHHRNAEIG